MSKNCVFTICSHNYLAQALTLKESFIRYNSEDFKIFLADSPIDNGDYICLNEEWIPKWRSMAFKYNITEFNTSIKPFCFSYLFKMGYDKVIYLDPDIFVTDSLNIIWKALDSKSIILTPHICDINIVESKEYRERELLQDGICNLGFCAIKNNEIGECIVEWWKNRLQDQCFNEKDEGLFTDQKWMMFIPVFFPDHTLISHNFGLNVAVWNLPERQLEVVDEKYYIRRKKDRSLTPLIFFHFSGFNPRSPKYLTRRKPDINIETYPSFRPILKEYSEIIMHNGYDNYSSKTYGFSSFSNGLEILPFQRRLYRVYYENNGGDESDPFNVDSPFYKRLKKRGLVSNKKNVIAEISKEKRTSHAIEEKYVHPILIFVSRILGISKYSLLIKLFKHLSKLEYHYFLLKDRV